MASKPPRSSYKRSQAKPNLAKLDGPSSSQPSASSGKRFNPLKDYNLQYSRVPPETQSQLSPARKRKGKEKAIETLSEHIVDEEITDDRLWVDVYEPKSEAELAVHTRKVEDVHRWLVEAFEGGPSGTLRRYRKILALTGPPGSGKTATIRVLARELGFDVLEWQNAVGDVLSYVTDYESAFAKFEAFLNRATSCRTLFSEPLPSSSGPQALSRSTRPGPYSVSARHIILLEDLPNILHPQTQDQFHAALRSFVESTSNSNTPIPVVIALSDATIRGDTRDELLTAGGGGTGWGREKSDVLDIRTVLPKDLIGGPYVTQILFNPIAPTLMKKALTALVERHISTKASSGSHLHASPLKDTINLIVESANGDIRSAIMALQFSCIGVKSEQRVKKRGAIASTVLMEAITRRESSLALFHLIGKVLYNKRKGDPPNSSASAKDIKKERELDIKLTDPPSLPLHLRKHERRASRVDVETLYADSPIDSSLFSLYIHQNYTQFCDELDECEGVIDWLSWVDSSGGEAWYQANPHRFHLLTLGTLHSLPSPVSRRSQKVYKPEYFEYLNKEKDAWGTVGDALFSMTTTSRGSESPIMATPRWSRWEVVLELGAVLKARTLNNNTSGSSPGNTRFPPSHVTFSRLVFTKGETQRGQQVDEADVIGGEDQRLGEDEQNCRSLAHAKDVKGVEKLEQSGVGGGWLEDDDIEEF